jgi:hypothetical protein
MCPAVSPLKTHKSKPTKIPSTGRDAPDISPDLPRLAAAAELFRSPEIVVRDCMIENLTLEDFSTQSILFENCALHRLNLTRSKFGGLRLRDVRMVECDFANSEALTSKMLRVEFLNCRLTGFRATEAECQHVLISGGDAAFSQFRFGVFKTCEFISCNLSESDFHHSDLRGAILRAAISRMRKWPEQSWKAPISEVRVWKALWLTQRTLKAQSLILPRPWSSRNLWV